MNKRFFLAGGSGSPPSVSPPAFATAFGFTSAALLDHFLSSSTIDMAQTYAPGFNWYILARNAPADIQSVTGSIITLQGSHIGVLVSAVPTSGDLNTINPGTVGKLFAGSDGFYAEASIQVRADLSNGTSQSAFWMQDCLTWLVAQGVSPVANAHNELDIQESWTPVQDNFQTQHSWSTTQVDTLRNAAGAGTFDDLDWTVYHTWGILVVPAAKNGGTGLLRFYVDRVQRGGDLTWAPAAQYSEVELNKLFIIAQAESPLTYKIDYIAVWNSGAGWDGPVTNLTHRWPMSDAHVVGTSIKDVVGTLHGTAGTGISSTIGPMCDQARLSNGVTAQGYITLPSAPIADLTAAWSIAGALKLTALAGGANLTLAQLDDSTNQLRFVLDRTATVGALCATREGSVSQFSTAAAVFAAGAYIHFVVTFDGAGTYKVYRQGINVSIGGAAQVANPSTGTCLLAQSAAAANSINGALEQFVTYTKELTVAEVIQLYNAYEPA